MRLAIATGTAPTDWTDLADLLTAEELLSKP